MGPDVDGTISSNKEIWHDNTLYYTQDENISLTLSYTGTPDEGYTHNFTASAGTLVPTGNGYQLTMPASKDVIISADATQLRDIGYKAWVDISCPRQQYTGSALTPVVTVTDSKSGTPVTLSEGTDYQLIMPDGDVIQPGKYTIVVVGMGNYGGEAAVVFNVYHPTFSEGSGTEDDPYLIRNIAGMEAIASTVNGGNNLSGTIGGSITINVEEIGCRPVKIGELYGGGNQAGYSIYGYNDDGTPKETGTRLYNDPQVNVMSFTSIGNIYGGGFGGGATLVGNPTVNVNVAYGRYYNDEKSVVGENAKTPNNYPIPSHAKGKMGAINNVFGGGNAAKVIGNTNVNIATLDKVYVVKQVAVGEDVSSLFTRNNDGTYAAATGTAVDGTTYYEKKDVQGVDIRGNVYGGGNNAKVTGDSKVKIGKKDEGE